VLLAILLSAIPAARPALAQTFTVTQTGDVDDGSPSGCGADGCSLREAIRLANLSPGADTIAFSFAGAGPHEITPRTALPAVTGDSTTIDGANLATGQPFQVVLSGTALVADNRVGHGLLIRGSNVEVRNLVIGGFPLGDTDISSGAGIFIDGSAGGGRNNRIYNNRIGVNAAGDGAFNNGRYGVRLGLGASDNRVGGTAAGQGNVIAGGGVANVGVGGAGETGLLSGNLIAGNLIGTNAAGSGQPAGVNTDQTEAGITVARGARNTVIDGNLIGGMTTTNPGNPVIAGILVSGDGTAANGAGIPAGTSIVRNLIGVNAAGAAVPNRVGIIMGGRAAYGPYSTTIGDPANPAGGRNVIAGNTNRGIEIRDTGFKFGDVTVAGNYIGLGPGGAPLPNGVFGLSTPGEGLYVGQYDAAEAGANPRVTVGPANVISANLSFGVRVRSGGHTIRGNFLGTDVSGAVSQLPIFGSNNSYTPRTANGSASIWIENGDGVTIGGAAAADRNVIGFSGSAVGGVGAGILVDPNVIPNSCDINPPCASGGHTIRGNYIGVRADGTAALNADATARLQREGLRLFASSGNTVSENVISGTGVGITVGGVVNGATYASSNNSISDNRIGTKASGDTSSLSAGIGNRQEGVRILAGAANQLARNLIAYNGGASSILEQYHAVLVGSAGASANGNSLLANRVVRNGAGGSGNGVQVDGATGVTISRTETSLNQGDGIGLSNGGNAGRAAPAVTGVTPGSPPVAAGAVSGCDGCTVEIFGSPTGEPGEGPTFIASGTASGGGFSVPVPGCLRFLSATVTDAAGNTSPFSATPLDTGAAGPCVAVAPPVLDPASPNARSVTPGSTATYVHRLSHSVQAERTYAIQITSSRGWASGPALVTLPAAPAGGTSSATFEVVVSVPANARTTAPPDQEVTTVQAFFGALSSAQQTDTTTAQEVAQTPAAPAVSPGQTKPFTPGSVTFTHTVTNTGTLAGNFEVVGLQIVGAPAGFGPAQATLNRTNIPGGQTATLTIVVPTPAVTPAPGAYTVRFAVGVVGGQQTPVVEDRIVVAAVRGFTFTPEAPQTASRPAGASVSFDYVLSNTGNAPDSFRVSGAPTGSGNPLTFVGAAVTGPGGVSSLSNLPAGAAANVRVTFAIPAGTPVGSYGVSVTAEAIGGTGAPAPVTRTATVTVTGGGAAAIGAGKGNPDPVDVRAAPATVTFTNVVTNTGNAAVPIVVPASFAAPAGITATVADADNTCNDTPTIAPGATCQFVVRALVPQDLDAGEYRITVTATADNSAITPPVQSATAEATNIVNVQRFRGVVIEPDRTLVGAPRAVLTFTHTLTNTGNGADSFTLTAAADLPGWSVLITPTRLLDVPRGASREVVVTAQVPAVAQAGDSNTITVRATADGSDAGDTAIDTAAVATITAADLSPGQRRNVDAGQTVTYSHTLTNTGTTRTAFSVTSADSQPGWSSTVSGSPTGALAPGEVFTVTVAVTAPAAAPLGVTNTTTLNVFAQGTSDPLLDSEQDVTVVGPAFGVLLAPDNVGTVLPRSTALFTHTLTNIGTSQGLFSLSAAEANGWPTTVTPSLVNLGPGQSFVVEVRVTVPDGVRADVPGQPSGFARVRAQLVSDPAVNDDATDTMTVGRVFGVDLSSSQARRIAAGGPAQGLSNLVVNNRGNALDTYDLTATGVPAGWRVRLTPSTVQVDKDSTFRVNVEVSVPDGIERGVRRITVEARSRSNPAARDSVELALLYDPQTRTFVFLPMVRQQGEPR
jgi:CSLREA domain-containing protein/uncharacterized repeat protein (TIGR01451 family)